MSEREEVEVVGVEGERRKRVEVEKRPAQPPLLSISCVVASFFNAFTSERRDFYPYAPSSVLFSAQMMSDEPRARPRLHRKRANRVE